MSETDSLSDRLSSRCGGDWHTLESMIREGDDWPVEEALEVRLKPRRASWIYVAVFSVTAAGTIRETLTTGTSDQSLALSNLQFTTVRPRKAVPGWQLEMVKALQGTLYEVCEVR
jgi:hypothetical protein